MSIKYDKYENVDPPAAWLTEQLRRRYNAPIYSVPPPSGEAIPRVTPRDPKDDKIAELRAALSEEKALSEKLNEQVIEMKKMLQEKEEEIECMFEAKNYFFHDMMQFKNKVEALEAHIEEKKIYEEIHNEREIRKSKEKEIIQLLGIQSISAPKRKRRPIGGLES